MPQLTPKAGTDWIPASHPSNPYNFPRDMMHAGKLPPLVTDNHVFFFGYEGEDHGDPHVCLQQWYPSPFKSEGADAQEFLTTEHYMMYQKALLMGDDEIAAKILAAPHPSEAKALGRQVKNFDHKKRDANCDGIVEMANYLKFSQHPDLRELLLSTGDKELIEASPNDKIWGIGFNSEEAMYHVDEWGNNGLGKALMRVRSRLKQLNSE